MERNGRLRRPTFKQVVLVSRSTKASAASLRWSGRRASNSLPQPWEGCALPGELLPHHGEVYVSTSASACAAASATTQRTSSEQSAAGPARRAESAACA